jgi:hypothetical protein
MRVLDGSVHDQYLSPKLLVEVLAEGASVARGSPLPHDTIGASWYHGEFYDPAAVTRPVTTRPECHFCDGQSLED